MDPWISEQSASVLGAAVGGGVGGILYGVIGGVCRVLAARGKARGFVLGYLAFLIVLGIAFLGFAVTAMVLDQPFHVWYIFALMGVVQLIVVPSILPSVKQQYRAFEQRRMDAQSVRAG